jgi:hypothetical protein
MNFVFQSRTMVCSSRWGKKQILYMGFVYLSMRMACSSRWRKKWSPCMEFVYWSRTMVCSSWWEQSGSRAYVTKYLLRCEICSAGTYFTENLFCRNFLNEKTNSWNIFHRKIYSAYVKFVLVSISRSTMKFVSEWTLQKQLLVSLLDKV